MLAAEKTVISMSWLGDLTKDIANALKPIDDWVNDYPDVYIWYIAFVFIIIAGLLFLWKFKAMQWVKLFVPKCLTKNMLKKKEQMMFNKYLERGVLDEYLK